MELKFVDEEGKPVRGYVVCKPSGVSGVTNNGYVRLDPVKTFEDIYCTIYPTDAHWISIYSLNSPEQFFVCKKVSSDAINWWKTATGLSDFVRKDHNFKVGLIDIGFVYTNGEQPLHIDIESKTLEDPYDCKKYHGHHIYSILIDSGIFQSNDVVVSDISYFFDRQKGDIDKLIGSIYNLVDEYRVDFINISYGIYLNLEDEDDRDTYNALFEAISYAQDCGCIIFAAVGNDKNSSPAIPAAFESVIGVGSIGMVSLAPDRTQSAKVEVDAAWTIGAVGSDGLGRRFFHDVTTCHGPGLDIVAPGVPIFVWWKSEYVVELSGTSFACPIAVCAVVACLVEDSHFGTLPLDSRYQYVKSRLPSWCQNLGISLHRQGHGLPGAIR